MQDIDYKIDNSGINLAIAWNNDSESYTYIATEMAAKETGANVMMLEMARSFDLKYDESGNLEEAKGAYGTLTPEAAKLIKTNTWRNSNCEELMQDIDCMIFPGGWDVSPSLFSKEQKLEVSEGNMDFSAERDVSDYVLLSYCLDHDIPILAICRGMQFLSIVSGAEIIQDLGSYFAAKGLEYDYMHRDKEKVVFRAHSVKVTSRNSLLYRITGRDVIEKVPSWHHQAVGDVTGTELEVTGFTNTNGRYVIEAVERPDKTFCLGVQFHPEATVRKLRDNENDAREFMSYDDAMVYFRALVDAADIKMGRDTRP